MAIPSGRGRWWRWSLLLPMLAVLAMAGQVYAASVVWSGATGNLDLGSGEGVIELTTAGTDKPTTFAVVEGKGLWVSEDLGKSWKQLGGDALPVSSPKGIAGSKDSNQVLFSGTSGKGGGLWRSDDAGKTWKLMGAAGDKISTCDVEQVTLSDKQPDLMLVGLRGGTKMLVSQDKGKTFAEVELGGEVVAQEPMIIDDNNWAVGSRAKGAIRCTTDAGKTWTAGEGGSDYFASAMSFAQVGDNIFSSRHHGNNRSEDGGQTWKFYMAGHTRIIGSAGEWIFQEGDRETIRGTKDRILVLQTSNNLAQSWQDCTGNIRELVPEKLRSNLIITTEQDPFAHIRIARAWASTVDGRNAFLSLGKAGLYRGEIFSQKGGPRVAEVSFTPASVIAGDTKTKIVIKAIITTRQAKVTKAYARLDSVGLGDLPLYDDGKHNDGEADDKTFGNSFSISKQAAAAIKSIPVIAEDDKNRVGSGEGTLKVTAASDRLIVWDGEKFARGQGWVAPQNPLNTLGSQTEEAHSGKSALEFRGSGGGYIGCGWNWHGWYPANAGNDVTAYRNFSFWIKIAMNEGDLGGLSVTLASSSSKKATQSVSISDYVQGAFADGKWHEVVIPMKDMLLKNEGFDTHTAWEMGLSSWAPKKRDFSIFIDDIGFDNREIRSHSEMVSLPLPRTPAALGADAISVKATVDLKAAGVAISPYIYGAAMGDHKAAKEMGMTTLRAGGNPISAFNWKKGFSSKGADWFYVNDGGLSSPEQSWMAKYHGANRKEGFETYFSLPAMGRVAKDATSVAFDINKYPGQDSWAGQAQPSDPHANAGSGRMFVKGPDGEKLKDKAGNPILKEIEPDPNDTSDEMSAKDQTDFLAFMIKDMGYGTADKGGIKFVAIDNEPILWNSTHRGMHPKGVSYDELWNVTLNFSKAIKQIDPSVQVAGPVTWGWSDLYYSGLDSQLISRGEGSWDAPPDFTAHGKVPLLKWWMKKLHDEEAKNGSRLVDILDVHFYPQTGIYMAGTINDPKTMEGRVQETRVLWDPTWKDPSWMGKEVNKVIRLIPMMKEWIKECNPGMKLSIGEYGFGGEGDVSGGVTQAELLGIFAREGLDHGYYWFFPPMNSSSYFGYKMFRNPDGAFSAFGDVYLPSTCSAADDISIHAGRDSKTGKLTFVVVNKRVAKGAKVHLELGQSLPAQNLVVYEYSDADRYCIGQWPDRNISGSAIDVEVPPLSVLRFDVKP